MLPIGDHNPTRHISKPFVTYALMAACVGVFLLELVGGSGLSQNNIYNFAVYPALFTNQASLPTGEMFPALRLISYQFLHGDTMHLLGNMLALWVVGDNVEDAMGHVRYLAFYLLGGIVAALAQVYFAGEPYTPMIGASGSIAALFAAYLLMHPFARFIMLFFFIPVTLPAIAFFAVWLAQQVFGVFAPNASNVAWWAHLGGFACGVALIPIFKFRNVPLHPMFAWLDFVHRTPTQKRWSKVRRQHASNVGKIQRLPVPQRKPRSPQEAEFKADYRAYLDSLMSKQDFEAKWGEDSIMQGKPTAVRPAEAKAQPWGVAPDESAKDQEYTQHRRRRSVMPSTHKKD